jgi:hypothetical protein
LNSKFDPAFGEALLGFNREAVVYCQGLSDTVAHDYAVEYARTLQNRVKGLDNVLPRIPHELFEPNRNLIRATLERMLDTYFPSKSRNTFRSGRTASPFPPEGPEGKDAGL